MGYCTIDESAEQVPDVKQWFVVYAINNGAESITSVIDVKAKSIVEAISISDVIPSAIISVSCFNTNIPAGQ